MINEVMNKDVGNQRIENFQEIKPDNKMTSKEADNFWKKEFAKESEKAKEDYASREYFDDNGEKYREGNDLLPNKEFSVRGYDYKTDDKGRVVSAEGKLQMKDHSGRGDIDDRSEVDRGHMLNSDDRGHLIADRFNGSGGIENVLPMDHDLNHGDYAKLENTLAEAVKDGADVRLKVEPVYDGNSTRPAEFRVSYSVDGEKTVTVFKNEREAAA